MAGADPSVRSGGGGVPSGVSSRRGSGPSDPRAGSADRAPDPSPRGQPADRDGGGSSDLDRRVLAAIIDKFDGGPVGIETIAAATSEETDAIMDVYEPYLLQLGFIARTPRGRVVTQRGYEHLSRKPSARAKERLGLLLQEETVTATGPVQSRLWDETTS